MPCRGCNLRPGRKFACLGRLASETGWKHFDLIKVRAQRPGVVLDVACVAVASVGRECRAGATRLSPPLHGCPSFPPQRLEAKRKVKAEAFYAKKKATNALRAKAAASVDA